MGGGASFVRMRFVLVAILWIQLLSAQTQPSNVCEVLNSAVNRQVVTIHAILAGGELVEGSGQEPCPGWPRHFFTAPSAIPLMTSSYAGVTIPDSLRKTNFNFLVRMWSLQRKNPSSRYWMAVNGVLIRKPWLLSYRGLDGVYVGWGEGLYGGNAALLVVTAPIVNQ